MNSEKPKWYYNRWMVLVTLFLVAGPVGLPLLWRSPQFSDRAKWLLTAVVLIYTVTVLVLFVVTLQKMLQQIHQFETSLR